MSVVVAASADIGASTLEDVCRPVAGTAPILLCGTKKKGQKNSVPWVYGGGWFSQHEFLFTLKRAQ